MFSSLIRGIYCGHFYKKGEYFMPKKESNIRKRKDGRWEARYIKGKDENGRSIYSSIYGKTYSEVKLKRQECLKKISINKKQNQDFYSVYINWLTFIEKRVKESTYARYKYICEHYILNEFKNYKIEDIKTSTVENFIYQKYRTKENSNGYAAATIKVILSVLKSIFNYANSLNYNVNCFIDLIQIKSEIQEPRYLSIEEQKVIESKIYQEHNYIHLGIWLGLYTGLRIGELCALKWSDVNYDMKCIYIHKTLQRIIDPYSDDEKKTKIIIDQPKSKNSKRIIPIPEFILQKIISLRPLDTNTYILTATHKYMEPRVFEYHFDKVMKDCQLNGVHFHTLRHTFTTRCIELGFEIKALSEILGHSSVTFTLDRYGHSSLETKKSLVNQLHSTLY